MRVCRVNKRRLYFHLLEISPKLNECVRRVVASASVRKAIFVSSDFLFIQDLMGMEVEIVVRHFLVLFFFSFNPWESVTGKMPTKIDHEAINFCHSFGKKVVGSVDG